MKKHWLNRERMELYSCFMLVIYVVIAVGWIVRSRHGVDISGKPFAFDYVTFWAAARLALSGHPVAAYDLHSLMQEERLALPGVGANNPWYYPPGFLLLILPLGLMPYLLSYAVFAALGFAAFFVAVRRTGGAPGAWLPLLAFPAVFLNLFSGQNGLLTAALIGFALLLLRHRPLLAGALIGLLTVKPHLGLLLPLALLCGRHWRALGSAALTACLLLGLSVWVLGADTLAAFLAAIPKVAEWVADGKLPLGKMPTFFAFGRLLGLPLPAAYILQGVIALSVAAAVGWVWLRCSDFALCAAALLAGTLLTSAYLFDYDLAWLALVIAWFTRFTMRRGWLNWEREILAAVWLLPILTLPMYWLTHQQLAPFLLLALLLMILRRVSVEITAQSSGGPASAIPALADEIAAA